MGAGAWLATKSETELQQREIAHERREILEESEHEFEELVLLYQLKGFSEAESHKLATHVAKDTDLFVKTMAQEELGITAESAGNPWMSAFVGSISTFVGGIAPLIPFFFLHGLVAIILAATVSILAHFAVGAAKSLVTARSWWASGLEMTVAGIIVGVVAYGLGLLGALVVRM